MLSPSEAGARPPPTSTRRTGGDDDDDDRTEDRRPTEQDGKGTRTPTPVKRDRQNRSLHRLSTAAAPFRGATPLTAAVRIQSVRRRARSSELRESSPVVAETNDAVDTVMILPQVHLRKPCYDFYFL